MMFFLKLSVSAGLIAWVFFYKVDLSELLGAIQGIDVRLILLACAMQIIGLLISALRWQTLLRLQGTRVKLLPLIDSYLVGFYFNLFMPTRIGGDVIRVTDLRQASRSLTRSASSVFVERFLGMGVLLVFALCASAFRLGSSVESPGIWLGLGFGMFGLGLLLCLIYSRFIGVLIGVIPSSKIKTRIVPTWEKFRGNVIALLSQRKALIWGIGYSLLLQVNVIIYFWIIGEALGFGILLLDYFYLIPVQLVILMLPSINGVGLREASSVFLFASYGIVPAEAATFGLIELLRTLVVGLIGGIRFMTRRSLPQVMEASEGARNWT